MQTLIWVAAMLLVWTPQSHVLLRSHDWIADYGAHVGGSVYLDMPEMGVVGDAQVLAIESCPPLEPGEGRLVTATFRHEGGTSYDLKLESESEPIGVTALHPIWSVDREAWVSAVELEEREQVMTLAGTSCVESLVAREKVEPVYNIEVDGDHVYRVGESGLLVHNDSADVAPAPCPNPDDVTINSTHILGEARPDNKGTGGHYLNPKIRIESIETPPNADEVYVAKISVKDDSGVWRPKAGAGISTMWPDDWSEEKIKRTIREAFVDAGSPTSGGRWYGVSTEGFKATGWPKNSSKPEFDVYSAWPDV